MDGRWLARVIIIIESEKALLTHGGMGSLWYYKKNFKNFILLLNGKFQIEVTIREYL